MLISNHAIEQANYRGSLAGFTLDQVLAKTERLERRIENLLYDGADLVMVLVGRVNGKDRLSDGSLGVSLPDGSNGNVVVACVQLTNNGPKVVPIIVTVFLQRQTQIIRKGQRGENVYVW